MKPVEDLKKIADANLAGLDLSEEVKDKLRAERRAGKSLKSLAAKLSTVAAVAVILIVALIFSNIGSETANPLYVPVKAEGDLMKGIIAAGVSEAELTDEFRTAAADFSVKLLQQSLSENGNTMVSPLSVELALAMTANGAENTTLQQFEKLLGGGMPAEQLNGQLYSLSKQLQNVKSGKVKLASSIWFRKAEGFTVNQPFLQTNADYYGAAAYSADFDDPGTADDMNRWIKENTDGLIDKMVDTIDADTMLYLFNTLLFDCEWEAIYHENQVYPSNFKTPGGEVSAQFMASEEATYLKDGNKAEGFLKPYQGGQYSFLALLPNEKTDVEDYVKSLTGEKLLNIQKNAKQEGVSAALPKFKSEYEITLNQPLQKLGLKKAFSDEAEFGRMSSTPLYVSKVKHKTYIEVAEKGTKAGAATSVEMKTMGIASGKLVTLDRPFVYAVVDNATHLPLFIGVVTDPNK